MEPGPWNVEENVEKYNLKDLFSKVKFSDKKLDGVKYSGNARPGDKDITAWVKSLMEQLKLNDSRVSYESSITLAAIKTGLKQFLWSTDIRPDGVVLLSFTFDDTVWKLPMVIIEVHSSPYERTLAKTAADVIEQLRLLRCFNKNIEECVGFAFPKYEIKTCVTKVSVSFKKFKFVIQLQALCIEEVKSEIKETLKQAMEFHADSPVFSFMRLSDADIEIAKIAVKESVIQCNSRFSILLRNEARFFKLVPDLAESRNLFTMNTVLSKDDVTCKHVTLYSSIDMVDDQLFYCYPAQLHPLRKDQVKTCLLDFMTRTAIALQELHKNGFAHLDVRIPNICFAKDKDDGKYMVKLIDLDRCSRCYNRTGLPYRGEMYRVPVYNWTTAQLDWKQLGLIATNIIWPEDSYKDIVHRVRDDIFFNSLLLKGIYRALHTHDT